MLDSSKKSEFTVSLLEHHKRQISYRCNSKITEEIRNHYGDLDGANQRIISNIFSQLDKKQKNRLDAMASSYNQRRKQSDAS